MEINLRLDGAFKGNKNEGKIEKYLMLTIAILDFAYCLKLSQLQTIQ